jgi:hypothetical protein
MEEREYSSDTDDDDYVPTDGSEVSEELSDAAVDEGEGDISVKTKKGKKRRKRSKMTEARKRNGGIKLDDENEAQEGEQEEQPVVEDVKPVTEEQEKKRSDSLWSDFLKDVGPPIRPKSSTPSSATVPKPITQTPARSTSTTPSSSLMSTPASTNKITVTKVFDFAGEEVSVTEDVDINSKEGKLALSRTPMTPVTTPNNGSSSTQSTPAGPTPRRSGLGNIVGLISGKKTKMSTLTKSNLDWKAFKEQEGIEDELQQHNKGKDGYLERQAFLERADLKQFEMEKSLRAANRSNR